MLAEDLTSSAVIKEIRHLAKEHSVPVRVVPRRELEKITAGGNHQGVAALTARYRYAALEKLLAVDQARLLFLDGLNDPHNLGSLLRSADAAGFTGVVIPARNSVGVTAAVRRVAAGAAEIVPVARVTNLSRALEDAKQAGMWIHGLDGEAETTMWDADLEPPLGLVVGAEGAGMRSNTKQHCDTLLRIPRLGRLESLNAAVAGALAMFEVTRRMQGFR